MVRIGLGSISAVVAALAMGIAVEARGPRAADPVTTGWKADRLDLSVSGPARRGDSGVRYSLASQSARNVQLASLETGVDSDAASEEDEAPSAAPTAARASASFDERFLFDGRPVSFDDRFAVTGVRPDRGQDDAAPVVLDDVAPDRAQDHAAPKPRATATRPAPAKAQSRLPAVRHPKLAMLTPTPLASVSNKRFRVDEAARESATPPETDNRTAIYDISAHAVYLPNGKKLEAHSGLGSHMDDPGSISLKSRGPTPPNVYKLALRERIFHGVRAIRLIPVDDGKMFGRDGILAHPYMLGSNGQSNGCVSFSNYPAFLNAYLNGDVDRLVVVEHLANAPTPKAGSGWLADAVGGLFKPLRRAAAGGHGAGRDPALSYE